MINEISEEEMNALTNSIFVRYGVDFTCYEPKSLRRRIIRLMNRMDMSSIHELWIKFLREPDFKHVFMNEVSVGMTSMFRDPILWRKLRGRLNAEFRGQRSISVWHAGCSTGEEVYSFGILLKESEMIERSKALATDFNKDALEEARKGEYHRLKMIENETNYRIFNPSNTFTQYFTTDGKNDCMDNALTKHASFQYHNLITDPYPKGFDIIFCRNVMIYFDNAAKVKLLEKFYQSLNYGGYFVIGFFDTMSHLIDNDKFELVDSDAKIFKKVGKKQSSDFME
jgi:chemotaxis protein methyltransferase CheR